MDAIIPEDISYLNFLNDKTHSLLLQTSNEGGELQENSLNVEPIFTEFVEGNATWTIGGVPVYLNAPVLEEHNEAAELETTEPTKLDSVDPETMGFPIEIPGKGFLTSSGLFFSNEVLLELNLQNGEGEVVEKQNSVEIVANDKAKKDVGTNADKQEVAQEEGDVNDLIEIVPMHKCRKCSMLFERYNDIVSHIQNVCKEKKSPSPKVQKMSSLLNRDENKKPVVKDIFLCGMCENVGYENLENLKKHMLCKHNLTYNGSSDPVKTDKQKNKAVFQNIVNKQQAEGKKVKCLIKGCDSRFSRIELMMRHHECHVGGEKKKFKCPECEKIFFIWRLCSAHMWKCHKIDVGLFTCSVCNVFKTLTPHNLLIHMAEHDSAMPIKPYLCAVCGKEFKLLAHLKSHEIVHKQINELGKWAPSKKTCTICNRVFQNSKILKKHVQAVHNKYKPFICNICGHQCARKSMLELHLRQHTGEKPYKCDLCDYKTGDHNSLRRHRSRHYGTTKYSCPHCDYRTIQSIAYKLHMKRQHPGKEGVFSCLVCSFETVNEQLYSDHLKEHTIGLLNGVPIKVETVNKTGPSNVATQKLMPNLEDDETQPGLFSSDHLEDLTTVDTGGITIPAGSEMEIC